VSCMTIHFCGMDLDVEFDYTPYCKGSRGPHGEPLEPDDDEDIEITEIKHKDVDVTELMDYADICDKILEIVWKDFRSNEP